MLVTPVLATTCQRVRVMQKYITAHKRQKAKQMLHAHTNVRAKHVVQRCTSSSVVKEQKWDARTQCGPSC